MSDARVFDAHTAQPITPPLRHADRVWVAHFSPDGRWVATASEDNTARVWDAQSGFPITDPLTHQHTVSAIAWLLDSQQFLTASHDGTVRLWKPPQFDSVPSWLPDLAEALAGKRDDGLGGRVPVSTDRLDALRRLAEKSADDTPQHRWLRWFLIDRLQGTTP